MKDIRLVLGSGGARGMAHIGVIEELEREGYVIKEVVGCSMGAVVGGIYCAGFLQDYKKWLTKLTKLEVLRLFDFVFSSQGLVKGEKVFKVIEGLIGTHQIENLDIPFTAVACDIVGRKEVHYKSGSLFKALRASIAIPSVFTPVSEGEALLVDGGVLNPLPVNLVERQSTEIVVAVNVNANTRVSAASKPNQRKENSNVLEVFGLDMFKPKENQKTSPEMYGFFDLLAKSFYLTQDRVIELMLARHKPEVVVNVSRDICGIFEFYKAQEVIEAGKLAFQESHREYIKRNAGD
jgi:NTE family protein